MEPTIVVGLDFGTTFSGFAYARVAEPDVVYKFYEWPELKAAGAMHYCKTQTSLLYEREPSSGSYRLLDWGYSAYVKHSRGTKSRLEQSSGSRATHGMANQLRLLSISNSTHQPRMHFVTLFKLHLAGAGAGRTSAANLPEGLTSRRVISDYLRKLSEFIMTQLKSHIGNYITMNDVQWCLTVPAIWDDHAKQEMKICASVAGMVKGPDCPLESQNSASPHPVIIVLEPEAASLYCLGKGSINSQSSINSGDKFLIVDVGGGTVDLVLQEKIDAGSDLRVREVSSSSGGLFGGSNVDKNFFEFLGRKISCYESFADKHGDSVLKINGWWETIKGSFDGTMLSPLELELPARLAREWEKDESANGLWRESYDEIELSLGEMLSFFDPVVNGILGLVESKMTGVNLKAMMIVGGFSGSPYVVKKIRERFSSRVASIMIPHEPGSAICCGAVAYGINGADVIVSRISKKTYGLYLARPSKSTDPPHLIFTDDDGVSRCRHAFDVFVRRNDEIPLNHCVKRDSFPLYKRQTSTSLSLYSTSEVYPKYTTDPGVTQRGTFNLVHPSEYELGKPPEILISMYFGRTLIEVEAEGGNFGDGEKFKMPPVRFEH